MGSKNALLFIKQKKDGKAKDVILKTVNIH